MESSTMAELRLQNDLLNVSEPYNISEREENQK